MSETRPAREFFNRQHGAHRLPARNSGERLFKCRARERFKAGRKSGTRDLTIGAGLALERNLAICGRIHFPQPFETSPAKTKALRGRLMP